MLQACSGTFRQEGPGAPENDFYAMITTTSSRPEVIMGYAEMLLEDKGKLDGQSRKMVEGIESNSEKILGMLEEFLTISRLESGKFVTNLAPEGIPEVVSSVYKQFLPIARKKNVRLETSVQDDMGISCIDRRYLGRAVSNLVQNALKFTAEGGGNNSGRTDDSFVISVSDTGTGIPAGELGRIFEKYYRSSNASSIKGTGLGLAIVKTIVEAHGGRVEVESEEGKGSTFRYSYPSILQLAPPGQPRLTSIEITSNANKTPARTNQGMVSQWMSGVADEEAQV
jgi:signal transduction histidine kinase